MGASIVEILINATDNASSKVDSVARSLDRLGSMGGKTTAILAGVSGSLAGMAPAVAGVGALASTFASAGLGAVGFGAVAVSSISKVVDAQGEIVKAEQAIKDADSTEERIKAQQKLKEIYAGMSTAQRGAVTDLQNFTSWWGKFTASFDTPVFKVFGEGLKLIQNTMTAMQPAIMAVGNALGGFLEKVNSSFDTSTAQSFFNYINTTAGGSFSAVMTSAGNIMVGFMGILQAFGPLSGQFNNGMISMTQSFAQWGQSLASSRGFQNFVSFVQANTPVVLSLIRNLWSFLVQLVTALAPLGSVVLQVANSFAQWLASSSTMSSVMSAISSAGQFLAQHLTAVKTVLVGVIAGFLLFKTVITIVATVQAVIRAFQLFKTAITAVRTAMIMLNVAMLTNPFTWIVIAIVAVIAIIVLLVMHWDKVKQACITAGQAIKTAFTNMVSALAGVGSAIAGFVTSVLQAFHNFKVMVVQAVVTAITEVVQWFVRMGTMIGSAVSSAISTTVQFFHNLKVQIVQAVVSAVTAVVQKFVQLGSQIGSAVSSAVSRVVQFFSQMGSQIASTVSSMVSRVVSFFTQLGSRISSAVSSAVSRVVQFFSQMGSQISSVVSNLVSQVANWFTQMGSRILSAITSMASSVGSAISSMASNIMSAVSSMASNIVSSITSAMSSFVSAVTSGASNALSAIRSGLQSMISAIKGFVGSFASAGRGLIDAFTSGIKSAMGKAKSAVSSGMSSIRSLLPFSPAKEGPLSDLDKSGESFFPTWYEGALKKVRPMTRAISGAMSGLNSELESRGSGVALESFGVTSQKTVVVKVEGAINVSGDTNKETFKYASEQAVTNVSETDLLGGLRQALRQR
ncbi:hypothetical protein CN367_11685 [Priestia megaterium]|uniref:phage tail protein n=1 Tax=Priestia megaterium TaxID=1404 RepID=UPI000BF3F2C9|nr:hypothetical protein [Priestia megaterium]PEZ47023.1 hypothetical protein CN367_11685 [Priestia megaterium]